jgi:ligand-binding sensor domain-containing protein/serine phosphatase RsbU (regulator of sigma subunit)
MQLLKFIYFLLIFSISFSIHSQNYNFQNFSVDNGLSQSQILSIYQDKTGEIWFGTNNGGISIFNGKTFSYLTTKNGLADNIVYSIERGPDNNIYVGTNNGLSIIKPDTILNIDTALGLTHNRVFKIFFDSKNRCWIGTGNGINFLENGKIKSFEKNTLFENKGVFNFYEDNNKNIWVSTMGTGLFRISPKDIINFNSNNSALSDIIYSTQHIYGKLWVFTNKGAFEYNDTNLFVLKHIDKNKLTYPIYAAVKDNEAYWIGTYSGIFKYDGKHFTNITNQNGLVDNDIFKILKDREGNIWFASKNNGISKLTSERFTFYNQNNLFTDEITTVIKNSNNQLMIGAPLGLIIKTENNIELFNNKNNKTIQEKVNDINRIFEIDKNTFIIGTNTEGAFYFDNAKKKFSPILSLGGRSYQLIYHIYKDKNEDIWVCSKNGLSKLENGIIKPYLPQIIPQTDIFQIYQDFNGNYWLATDNGVYLFDGTSTYQFSEKEGIKKGRIRSVIQTKDSTIWLSSNNGVYRFKNNKFTNISEKNGLASNIIYSLIADSKESIWVGHQYGIDKIILNNDTYSVKNYKNEDGFSGQQCLLNSIYIDENDIIYIGTLKGLVVYNPKFDKPNLKEPLTRITKVKIFSQEINWHDYTDSVSVNNIPIDPKLTYDKNYITIEFVAVAHTKPEQIAYKYKLVGLDKEWQISINKTEVAYSNLPPGKYEFLLFASNGDDIWNEKPVSLSFRISPPFWQTWWFYSICTGIIIAGIYSYLKIRTANKQIIQQNKIIEEKNKDITDSIIYAKRIQEAILPANKTLSTHFSDSFILFKPRDIVSGDFYWFTEDSEKSIVVVSDCTGHGVPGAFMSMLGTSLLNQVIRDENISNPGKALDRMDEKLNMALHKTNNETKAQDGMDISVCTFLKDKEIIEYSGANNPLYIVRKNKDALIINNTEVPALFQDKNYYFYEIKANKQPIGGFQHKKDFTTHKIKIQKSDCIYLFTDGYADQFGGPKGKKFMYVQFKKLLLSIQHLSMQEQKLELEKIIENWKGSSHNQVDDICIMGVKI